MLFDSVNEFLLVNVIEFLCRFFECDNDVFAKESLSRLMNDPNACLIDNIVN